uniref:Peptidase S1 domain-containing protein n=1 Tax=Varanus komodoensis TaxID=61221 RepID=A0A8D2L3H1_VARKO
KWTPVLLELPTLPQKRDRIIGGYTCPARSRAFQAALVSGRRGNWRIYCGGSLVHQCWVLSAAHCKPRAGMMVCLGKQNLKKIENTEQCSHIAEVKTHPQYDRRTNDKDYMLLRISPCARLSEAVQTVPLPSGCPADGMHCTVSGWGTIKSPEGGEEGWSPGRAPGDLGDGTHLLLPAATPHCCGLCNLGCTMDIRGFPLGSARLAGPGRAC